jgi:hypothetical protein
LVETVLSPRLRDAIQNLYATFASYTLPPYTAPCPHCHTLEDEARLHAKPLLELRVPDLRGYAVDALLVWGDERVFKSLLPRLFELYMLSPDPAIDFTGPEIVFSKFRHGSWRKWPGPEQAAVEVFLHAVWGEVIAHPAPVDAFLDTESWLCAIAQSEDDLSPYLAQWLAEDSLSGVSGLPSSY